MKSGLKLSLVAMGGMEGGAAIVLVSTGVVDVDDDAAVNGVHN